MGTIHCYSIGYVFWGKQQLVVLLLVDYVILITERHGF